MLALMSAPTSGYSVAKGPVALLVDSRSLACLRRAEVRPKNGRRVGLEFVPLERCRPCLRRIAQARVVSGRCVGSSGTSGVFSGGNSCEGPEPARLASPVPCERNHVSWESLLRLSTSTSRASPGVVRRPNQAETSHVACGQKLVSFVPASAWIAGQYSSSKAACGPGRRLGEEGVWHGSGREGFATPRRRSGRRGAWRLASCGKQASGCRERLEDGCRALESP